MLTVTFEDILGGKTRMIVREVGIPGEMIQFAGLGWEQSLDKLAEGIVASGHTRIIAEPGKQEIVITRVFDAPRDIVFKANTDRDLITRWWKPRRFTTIVDKMDVRPGGLWRFINRDAVGNEYAFHGVYHEVAAPERIVDTFEFEGMPGHVSLETCTLQDIGCKTKVTTKSVYQSVEDRDGSLDAGMEEGVFETMDRLAELLGKLKVERKAA
ncbi:MAG TPA: SRPBCC family protein [Nitrospirota bacterium]|nr:SRPBCC family protein [Nitrospirota bacterium]